MRINYFFLILIFLLSNCTNDKKKNNINIKQNADAEKQTLHSENKLNENMATENKIILIGSGGGFTGSNSEYQIFPHGGVKKIVSPNQDTIKMNNINANLLGTIFEDFDQLQIDKHRFNKPGNMTMYIGYKKGTKVHMVKWGDHNFDPPDQFIDFYNFVMQEGIK